MNAQGGSSRAPALGGQLSPPGAFSSSSSSSSSRFHQQQQQSYYQENSSIFNNIDCHTNSLDNLKNSFGPNSDFTYLSPSGIDNPSEFNGNMVAATGTPTMDGIGFNSQQQQQMSMHHHSNNGMHHGMGGMGNMAGQQNHQYMNGFGNGNSGMMGSGGGSSSINNNNNSMNGMNGMRMMPGNNMGHNSVGMQMNPMGHMNAGGAMGSYNSSRHHHMSPMNQMQNMVGMASISGSNGGHMGHQINNMNPMAKMQGMANAGYSNRRMQPYPNAQMAPSKRASQANSIYSQNVPPSHHPGQMQYAHQSHPSHHNPHLQQQTHPSQQPNGVPVPMQPGYGRGNSMQNPYSRSGLQMMGRQQTTPPYGSNAQQFYSNGGNIPAPGGNMGLGGMGGCTPNNGYQNTQGFQQSMNYQHSPVPGNPTPPLTPACSVPYVSPNPDVKPKLNDNEEMRLTFPVRDGIILQPFRLLHNLSVSNHVFHLKPNVYNTLMGRNDLELQLKCFHQEDRQMGTNWPNTVTVSANATPLVIERTEDGQALRPLYLKQICLLGRNTLQLTASSCCCSHLFVLQLVHRPSVRQVLESLHKRNLLTVEQSVSKIKQFFRMGIAGNVPPNSENADQHQSPQVVQISLKCRIRNNRIRFPARGVDCKHIQCFDLENYLMLNCERGSWRCPECDTPALSERVEIDQYMWAILNNLRNSDAEEVTMDSQANWKEVKSILSDKLDIKQEPMHGFKDDGLNIKMEKCDEISKVMSPGSTALPTWDNNSQAMSPYMGYDMNSIANGNMIGQSGMNNMRNSFDNFNSNDQNDSSSGGGGNSANDSLAQLSETVNSLDPLTAIEKSLNDQMPHTPHTPHTPNPHTPSGCGNSTSHPLTPGGPPSVNSPHNESSSNNFNSSNGVGNSSQNSSQSNTPSKTPSGNTSSSGNSSNNNANSRESNSEQLINSLIGSAEVLLNDSDLNSDLNFDPASGIEGDQDLLKDSVVDPMEILSYLEPQPDLNTPPSSGSSNNPNQDDILASLFE